MTLQAPNTKSQIIPMTQIQNSKQLVRLHMG